MPEIIEVRIALQVRAFIKSPLHGRPSLAAVPAAIRPSASPRSFDRVAIRRAGTGLWRRDFPTARLRTSSVWRRRRLHPRWRRHGYGRSPAHPLHERE